MFTNAISATWANKSTRYNRELAMIFLLSPFVFITFGLVTKRFGLAITSAIIDAFIVICTVAIGLFVYKEWNKISVGQIVGILITAVGIFCMLYFEKVPGQK